MITLDRETARELYGDLLTSASGTLSTEKESAPEYRRLAHELWRIQGSADRVELTPELVEIASKFGYIG